jgi:heme A synthase
MLRRILIGLLWAVPAYLAGAFGGGFLLYLLSPNRHDRSLEAAMTGAFVLGPLAAIVGFVTGAVRAKARPVAPELPPPPSTN